MRLTKALYGLFTVALLWASSSLWAQLNVTTTGIDYVIDFDSGLAGVTNGTYQGNGLNGFGGSGTLNSRAWRFNRIGGVSTDYGLFVYNTGDFALGRWNTPRSQGGLYSFYGGTIGSTSSSSALAIQPGGDSMVSTGFFELRCENTTGLYLTSVALSYEIHLRNDENRSTYINTSLRTESMNTFTNLTDGKISPASLMYSTPSTSTGSSLTQVDMSHSFNGVYIAPGEYFYVLFDVGDAGGSGSRDEFAIDDITINVEGTNDLTFYTQNSGQQYGTGTSTTLLWSTVPSGNVQFKITPFQDDADYVIQTGHSMTLRNSGANYSMRDLTIEAGGVLISDNVAAASGAQKYLNILGDIVCDGTMGNSTGGLGSNISLQFEAGSHSISGTGSIDISRLRRSDVQLSNGPCDLDIQMDVNLRFNQNALYNDRSGGANNFFNIHVAPGATLYSVGYVGLDGSNPLSNFLEQAGTIDVEGILEIDYAYYATTTNNSSPCSLIVRNGGRVNTGFIESSASGSAGHTILLEPGGILDLKGHPISTLNTTWENFSSTNNTFNFNPGSTVRYSKSGQQSLLRSLEYPNLILSTAGNKTVSPIGGPLIVHEDLTIQNSAVLRPNGQDIHLSGNWTNYHESGFAETGVTVVFDDASGSSSINCGGTELFDNVTFSSGTTVLDADIDIFGSLNLNATVDLNSHNVLIRDPSSVGPYNTLNSFFVSEDTGHQGSVSITINNYSAPVDFPFGTASGDPIYARILLNSGYIGTVTMATYPTGDNNLPWPVSPVAVNNLNSVNGLSPDNQSATADRFWSVTSNATVYDADLSISLTTDDISGNANIGAISSLVGQRYDDATDSWEPPAAGQLVLNGAFGNPNSIQISIPNVSAFSPWAVAGSANPLPVELLSYNGKATANGVLLTWKTASEVNSSHYSIHRFTDDFDETMLGSVEAAGQSSSILDYSFTDKTPEKGWNYYRLIQHDFDGTQHDEGVVEVWWEDPSELALAQVSWNPAELTIRINDPEAPSMIHLWDVRGRLLHQVSNPVGQETVVIPLQSDESMYLLDIIQGVHRQSQKIVLIRP